MFSISTHMFIISLSVSAICSISVNIPTFLFACNGCFSDVRCLSQILLPSSHFSPPASGS